jgi:hypothetical protein
MLVFTLASLKRSDSNSPTNAPRTLFSRYNRQGDGRKGMQG